MRISKCLFDTQPIMMPTACEAMLRYIFLCLIPSQYLKAHVVIIIINRQLYGGQGDHKTAIDNPSGVHTFLGVDLCDTA